MIVAVLYVITVIVGCALAVLFASRVERAFAALNADRERERREWTRERQLLLNRIKPETAQHVPSDAQLWAPQAVHPDIDEEWWESKEELAERLAAEETA